MARLRVRSGQAAGMTPELIAILGVGVMLAGLIWQGQRSLRADFRAERQSLRAELGARMDRIEAELRGIRERLARLEGKVDFLEACISGRNERPAPAAE